MLINTNGIIVFLIIYIWSFYQRIFIDQLILLKLEYIRTYYRTDLKIWKSSN